MSYAAKLSAEFSAQNTLVAFVGVHVIPMDTERMLTDRREMLVSMTVAVA